MQYLVTISQTITVEADDENDAMVVAAEMFDFGSAEFNTERVWDDESYIKAV